MRENRNTKEEIFLLCHPLLGIVPPGDEAGLDLPNLSPGDEAGLDLPNNLPNLPWGDEAGLDLPNLPPGDEAGLNLPNNLPNLPPGDKAGLDLRNDLPNLPSGVSRVSSHHLLLFLDLAGESLEFILHSKLAHLNLSASVLTLTTAAASGAPHILPHQREAPNRVHQLTSRVVLVQFLVHRQ